jgi:hypothetical protein
MLTREQIEQQVETDLPTEAMDRVIASAYGEVADFAGPDGEITEPHIEPGGRVLFTSYPVATITGVVEVDPDGTETPVAESEYRLRGNYEVVHNSRRWADEVVVTYQRRDDSAVRDEVAVELVRLIVEHRAPVQEQTGGLGGYRADYSGFERRKRDAMRRLTRTSGVVA